MCDVEMLKIWNAKPPHRQRLWGAKFIPRHFAVASLGMFSTKVDLGHPNGGFGWLV
jgi:hypothetical protein